MHLSVRARRTCVLCHHIVGFAKINIRWLCERARLLRRAIVHSAQFCELGRECGKEQMRLVCRSSPIELLLCGVFFSFFDRLCDNHVGFASFHSFIFVSLRRSFLLRFCSASVVIVCAVLFVHSRFGLFVVHLHIATRTNHTRRANTFHIDRSTIYTWNSERCSLAKPNKFRYLRRIQMPKWTHLNRRWTIGKLLNIDS